jgi:hypothetical protein
MSLSLDDKILGEKTHYYCSSSSEGEEEDDGSVEDTRNCKGSTSNSGEASAAPPCNASSYNGRCTNVSYLAP